MGSQEQMERTGKSRFGDLLQTVDEKVLEPLMYLRMTGLPGCLLGVIGFVWLGIVEGWLFRFSVAVVVGITAAALFSFAIARLVIVPLVVPILTRVPQWVGTLIILAVLIGVMVLVELLGRLI